MIGGLAMSEWKVAKWSQKKNKLQPMYQTLASDCKWQKSDSHQLCSALFTRNGSNTDSWSRWWDQLCQNYIDRDWKSNEPWPGGSVGALSWYVKVVGLIPSQGIYKNQPMIAYISGTTNLSLSNKCFKKEQWISNWDALAEKRTNGSSRKDSTKEAYRLTESPLRPWLVAWKAKHLQMVFLILWNSVDLHPDLALLMMLYLLKNW